MQSVNMYFHGEIDKNVVCIHKTNYHSSLKTVKPLTELEVSILGESHSGTNTTCISLIHENFKKWANRRREWE